MISFQQFLKEAPTKYTNNDLRRIMLDLNGKLYQNELKTDVVPITFKALPKGAAGHAVARLRKLSAVRKELVDAKIYVSPRNYTEEVLKGIVAHEMIHVILYQRGDFVTTHGGEFDRIRRQAEQKAGFPIPINHEGSDDEWDPSTLKEVLTIEMVRPDKTTFAFFKYDGNTPPVGILGQYKADFTVLLQAGKITKATIGTTRSVIQKNIPVSRIMKPRGVIYNQMYSRPSSNPPKFEWIKVFMELSV